MAQDPQLTQFFANPLYLAPSYAGASLGHRAVVSYRDQWSVVPNMYRTASVSYDINLASLRSGVGLFVLGDLAGDLNMGTIIAGFVYSYSVEMTNTWSFRPGIGIYYRQNVLNYNNARYLDQIMAGSEGQISSQSPGKKNLMDVDVSASILFHSFNGWVGFTADHLLMPKNTFYGGDTRLPMKFTLFGGYRFVLTSIYRQGVTQSITISSNLRYQQFFQFDLGGYWYKAPLILGVWYRGIPFGIQYATSDAVAFMLGCKFNVFQIAYSYDLTVSGLGPASGGSHEISFTYESPLPPRKRKYKAPVCPPY